MLKKKIFILLFLFCSTFAFSENVISWNITPANFGIYKFDQSNTTYKISEIRTLIGAEYDYLFASNFYVGGLINLGFDSYTLNFDAGKSIKLSGIAFDMFFAPAVGYKLGKRHFIGIQLLPLYFNYSSSSGYANVEAEYYGRTIKSSIEFSCKSFEIGSGLKMNFQWGNGLLRNGFYIGLYVPWNYKISDLDTEILKSDDFSFCPKTVRFEIGYKMSFVF